ncbi:exo-alpha-sialidase [Actomonas aquatica]|uniref:Beta-galactosidase n=1 Tax=Actomonas aquatica TaxID=2866162 RepID=A0ABZ1CD77_9BACT|nr:exo-alpha-sialidase [Opitutus sp. WL0086]WRQ88260.1 exo-alpha-sialidase [Opitutus sp. WL0086]
MTSLLSGTPFGSTSVATSVSEWLARRALHSLTLVATMVVGLTAPALHAAEDITPMENLPDAPTVVAAIRTLGGDATSRVVSLNGTWSFQLAPNDDAANALRKFYEPDFDATAFQPIAVPGCWTSLGFEEPHYINGTKSEGFYRRAFTAPAEADGRRVLLRFGGVWQSAEVWLNGQLLGRHDSGFTGFGFDASKVLKPGALNELAVRVRQQTPLFKLDANDDWGMPGIYRDVWLEIMPKEWNLESVETVTDFDESFTDATLQVRAFVMRNERADFFAPSPPFEVRAILSRDGQVVQTANFTGTVTGAHNSREVLLELPVKAPAPWTAETPNLYDLRVEVRRDDAVVHAWEDRIGFREVTIDGPVFKLNGQPIKLRGVARHDEHPDVGRATHREHWLEDIRLMKAANINAVRTSHYPPAEGFIRLCDELGLYVIEEVPLGFGGDRMSDPSYAEGAYLRMHETVTRDRNRPSVLVWSLGNEDPFSALHLAVLRALKGLDPTRPTLLPFRADEYLPPEVDILAPHYWKAKQYAAFAAVAQRPVITTEVSHAFGAEDFGEHDLRWDALTQFPAGAGAMIWTWADQGLRRKVNGREVLDPMADKAKMTRDGSELVREADAGPGEIYDSHGNHGTDGIVNADRSPQIDYWETRSAYAPVRVLVDHLPWTEGQPTVTVPLRNDYDFTNLSALTVHWSLFADADLVAQGSLPLQAAPHAKTSITVPTAPIAAIDVGALYLQLRFTDAAGRDVVTRSVQLGEVRAPAINRAESRFAVEEADGKLAIGTRDATYTFDRATGALSGLRIGDEAWVDGSEFLLWRKATYSERNVLDRRKVQHDWNTFLQGLPATVTAWSAENHVSTYVIRSTVDYTADANNHFTVDYTWTLTNEGVLTVDYEVSAQAEVEWLLELGIGLHLKDQPLSAEWVGWGPGKNLPNRHGSARFGQWSMPVFSGEARSTRSGVDWLRVHAQRSALLVQGLQAFRFDNRGKAGEGFNLRLLNDLAGAWVKGGPPERAEWRLDLTDGQGTFRGSLTLEPAVNVPFAAPAHPAVLRSEIINPNPPYPECHASTIVELADGTLAASWFGGTKERNPDVEIWFTRYENGAWQPARSVATGVQADGSDRQPTWNPVLFAPANAPLQLFYKVGPHPSTWWGEVITSTDGGLSWSAPRRLPDGIIGPVKNKPVIAPDGAWLSPTSTEGNKDGWLVHFERSTDHGATWTIAGPVDKGADFGLDGIQPSILFHPDGRLQAVGRTRNGVTFSTWSADNGLNWTPLEPLHVPHTGSGTDAVTLADGRQLLVFNDTAPPPERAHKGVRYPINLALSDDGITWRTVATLDVAPCPAGYAYPAVIQSRDGLVHITYTLNRDLIKHVVVDPSKLQ